MSVNRQIQTHTFYKEECGSWYIDLPEYIEQGGSKGDLAMVAGADTMLERIAGGHKRVTISIHTEPFTGADELTLLEVCEPSMGGGYYLMKVFEGKTVNQQMWLCDVTNFVFGYLPEKIFVRAVRLL